MQEGNSDWSNSRNGFNERPSSSSLSSHISNQSPITNPPQNSSRSPGPMTLGQPQEGSCSLRNNLINVINELGPLLQHARNAGAQGHSFRSLLKRPNPNQSENNMRSNNAESVVINFENVQEASTSNAQQSHGNNQVPETNQSDFSLELGGGIEHQNRTNQTQENRNNAVNSSNTFNLAPDTHFNEGAQAESPNRTNTSEGQSIENQYFPFFWFLFCKIIYDHREGILIFVGLFVTFVHANSVVKREIAKQGRRSLLSLGIIFVNLFVCICFVYFVFQDQHLYKNLVFLPPYTQPLNIWDLLWMVGITDFVLKFITIQLKVGMACFPAKLLPYSARGKWYLMLECTSQLYRGLVPIQPWLCYLMEVYKGPENAVGMFFSVAYMVSKGSDLMSKVKLFIKAFWKLLQNVNLGVHPSKEELDTAGSQCPICHDEYNAPIVLHCRHVFCEACVTTWFDREQTCPLCRAKVADDPSWRDGSTSFFVQLL